MVRNEALPDEQRVVITGLGAVTPLGLDVPTTWQNLLAGQSGIRRISEVKGHRINGEVDIAGMVHDFDPKKYLNPSNIGRTHLSHQYALAAAIEAGKDAGILDDSFIPEKDRSRNWLTDIEPERVGVIIGTGVGGTPQIAEVEDNELLGAVKEVSEKLGKSDDPSEKILSDVLGVTFEKILRELGRTSLKKSNLYILKMLPDRIASVTSLALGTQGVLYSPIAACATGVLALGQAYDAIKMGRADAVIAGSAEASVDPICLLAFQLIRALSTRDGNPELVSRPFDLTANGFVMSEGAGILVAERLSIAKKRNARIYAEILGYGNTSDSFSETAPDPKGKGAIRAMQNAIAEACLKPSDVDFIGAHATSTGEADGTELDNYKVVFGEELVRKIPIVAFKDRIGHMMGASGAVETIMGILAMRNGQIPGMRNLEDPRREGFDLVTGNRTQETSVYLKSSFGFGGINASMVLEVLK